MELDIGEKRRKYMKRKIIYTDTPIKVAEAIKQGSIVADFLPKPNALERKNKREKTTVDLDKNSLEFFSYVCSKTRN